MDIASIVNFIRAAATLFFIVCIVLSLPDIIAALFKQTKKYHGAIFAYTCKLAFASRKAPTYISRGWVFLQLKEYQRAISDCNQALALNPKRVAAYNIRGWAFLQLKEYQQAISDYNQAIALNPRLTEAYANRGWAFLQLKEYQQALSDCNQALTLNPKQATTYVTRSWAFIELKEYQQAISDCNQALALNPELASAYNNRGYAYFWTKEYQRALQDLDRALALNPLMNKAANNRIHVYYTIGKYQDILVECTRLIRAGSIEQRQSAYFNRAAMYLVQRKYQQALQDLEKAITLNPDHAASYNNRGCAYFYLKEYQRALADCDKAIALKPENGTFYETRAMVYLGLNQLEQAQSDLQTACALDPGFILHGWRKEYLAMCLHGVDQETAQRLEALAETDLTTAILFAPQDHVTHVCRGVAHWLRSDFEPALTELEQAILLDAYDEDAYFWVGMACASLGRDDEAHKALQRAVELGLLPIFLAPLRWLEPQRPDFYTRYAVPLLNGSQEYKGEIP